METDALGLFVRMATTFEDFLQVRTVRAAAYGHHDPQSAGAFGALETLDRAEGVAVLMCLERQSGQLVGTMRIQVSTYGPLVLEESVGLPQWLCTRPRAHLSRLAVAAGGHPMAKLLLMKGAYHYCLAMRIRWMVIGARKAALIRNYRNLGFKEVFDPEAWHPLASGGGLPHQILALDVTGAKSAWEASGNRWYNFMMEASYADLGLPSANDSAMQPLEVVNA